VQRLDYYEANRQNPSAAAQTFVSDSISLVGDLAEAYSAVDSDYKVVSDPPRVSYSVPPRFPANAELTTREATVWVNLLILDDGAVGEAYVAQSSNEGYGFERAALEAAMLHTYSAARHDGQYVACWTTLPIEFRLGN
jgi:TonB family protein